jgi:hypothetical protein
MSLRFQCEGSDSSGVCALRARLNNLAPNDSKRLEAMEVAESSAVRVWVGPNPPSDARAWIVDGNRLADGERALQENPHLMLIARTDTASGLVAEMHVVHERSRTPVYFQSRSEMEGYFAERLVSIQEAE